MFLFIAERIDGGYADVTGDEALHAIRVLRMKPGDDMLVTTLDGVMHKAVMEIASGNSFSARITESYPDWGKRDYSLRVCIAPTKNIDRYEWFLEKAVEIGIDRITPVCCEHSERRSVKPERCLKVVRAAVKQSIKSSLPVMDQMTDFYSLMKEDFRGQTLCIAHCDETTGRLDIRDVLKKGGNYTILIGPEGDFSKEEIAQAVSMGFSPVSFGENRLRTETAGVWAASLASIVN